MIDYLNFEYEGKMYHVEDEVGVKTEDGMMVEDTQKTFPDFDKGVWMWLQGFMLYEDFCSNGDDCPECRAMMKAEQ